MKNLHFAVASIALALLSVVQVVEANITAVDTKITNNTSTPLTFYRAAWNKDAAWPAGGAPRAPYAGWEADKAAEPIVVQPGETKLVGWVAAGLYNAFGSLVRDITNLNKSTIIRGGYVDFADGRPPVQLFVEHIPTWGRWNPAVRVDACARLLEPGELGKGCLSTGLTQIGIGTCPGCTFEDSTNSSVANGLWTDSHMFVNTPKMTVSAKGYVGVPYPDVVFTFADK